MTASQFDKARVMHATTEVLEQYLLGGLSPAEITVFQDHLSTCDVCQQTLTEVESQNDTVILQLREGKATNPIEAERACEEMIAQLSTFGQNSACVHEQPASDAAVPEMIRDYRLLEPLGRGGMGTVFKARHTKLDRIVAVKLLLQEKMSAAATARFEREMQIVGQLDHPHIVRATDAGVADDRPFLVMELLDGVDLDALVREHGPIDVSVACAIVRQAALGLQYAFEQGVVHRDIKPSNLMLARIPSGGWQVKVLDLGLALFEHSPVTSGELTSAGQVMGTIDYMAPEQGADTHRVDIRADIYSLGATLFRLLAGIAPLADPRRDSVMKKLTALATVEPPDVRTLRPDVPAPLAIFIQRLLAKRPEDRPNQPIEIAETLAPFAAGCELSALPTDPATKRPVLPRVTDPATKRPVLPRVDVRDLVSDSLKSRERRLVVAAGLAFTLLLAVIVFQFNTRDGVITVQLDTPQTISSIKVDGHVVKWALGKDPQQYRFEVKPGAVSSIVLQAEDGTEIYTEIPDKRLTISAGKAYTLTASTQPPTEKTESPPRNDRLVIDRVRSLGGEIGGGNPAVGYVAIKADEPLPQGRFDLVTINLTRRPVRDDDFALIQNLPHFSTLIASETVIGDDAIARLKSLPKLEGVYLSGTKLTDAGLKSLTRFQKLKHLHVADTQVTDEGVASITAWANLGFLFLDRCAITDKSVGVLAGPNNLRHLHITGTKLSQAGVERLRNALPQCKIESNYGVFEPQSSSTPNDDQDRLVAEWAHSQGGQVGLSKVHVRGYHFIQAKDELPPEPFVVLDLDLGRKRIRDRDLPRIDGLSACSSLSLARTDITDAGITTLGKLPQLKSLYLDGTKLSDAGLSTLPAKFPQIRLFEAKKTQLTDEGVKAIRSWGHMVELGLEELPLTDKALESFTGLKNLRKLALRSTKVTREGVERLHAALPACRIDSDHGVFEYSEPGDYALEFYFPALVTVPTLKYDGGPLTVEMTMRPESDAHMALALVGTSRVLFWRNENWQGVHLDHDGHRFSAVIEDPPALGRIVKVACVFDGQSLVYFIDGKIVAKGTANPMERSQGITGGYFGGDGQPSYRGSMDELRISKVARYDTDYVTQTRFETDADTIALYHFDEGHGNELKDSSGNDHHGRIRGAVWAKNDP